MSVEVRAKVGVVVVAAGNSIRYRPNTQKLLETIAPGIPVIASTLFALKRSNLIHCYALVVSKEIEKHIQDLAGKILAQSPYQIIRGGLSRQESVYLGLQSLPQKVNYVLVHDGARPLPSVELIKRVIEATTLSGAAVPVVAVTNTIKHARNNEIVKTVPREGLFEAQTPQGFSYQDLVDAHLKARQLELNTTDDAELIEKTLKSKIVTCEGDPDNIKITVPADLRLARLIYKERL
ncbi:2-C-methyl-D-erythritol 4-phosphate cytidylyltransferase [bacterium]|nr:2-C-methyl-D-erythritol 4-phosphate cytidylyltransferase [bacterium]